VAIDLEQPSSGCEGDEREDRADAHERELDTSQRDEERREERPDRERRHQEPLEQSEDAREEIGSRDALQQRAPGDVEGRSSASGDSEQEDRAQGARKRRDPHEREAPDRERQNEWERKPSKPNEPGGHDDGDDTSRPESSREIPGPVPAPMENALRQLDAEHVEGADCDSLRAQQQEEHGRLRIVPKKESEPPSLSPSPPSEPAVAAAGLTFLSGITRAAPSRQPKLASANTIASEPTASTTPASAGAASMLRLSIQPDATFVAVSSSGVRARPGAKADCVGRVIVNATDGPTSSA
jgi:hypothetical protein